MKPLASTSAIPDPYSKRILSNVLGKDSLKLYAQTPSKLRSLIRGLTPRQLRAVPPDGKWSITFIVSHLCDAEWAMGFRIRKALAEPGGSFQAYDQDKWAEHLYYDSADCSEKLSLFTELRKSHLSLLKMISPTDWRKFGIHEERGKESVERMVHMLAGHDVNHLLQITRLRGSLLAGRRPARKSR